MARLGVVAPNGAAYYSHGDINEVRAYLREAGLEIWVEKPIWKGWCSKDERLSGAIYFEDGQFHGAVWKTGE